MSKHKHKKTLRCRLWLHSWSCGNNPTCQGNHFCTRCGETPQP